MKTPKIKTFSVKSTPNTLHFFILSKGYNAGKPLEEPCPNCFIVTADDLKHKYQLYWVCYSLWKSGAYLPLLSGSVIPFLHIRDVEAEIERAIRVINTHESHFEKCVEQLQGLIRTERLLKMQLELISMTKASLAKKLIKGLPVYPIEKAGE